MGYPGADNPCDPNEIRLLAEGFQLRQKTLAEFSIKEINKQNYRFNGYCKLSQIMIQPHRFHHEHEHHD